MRQRFSTQDIVFQYVAPKIARKAHALRGNAHALVHALHAVGTITTGGPTQMKRFALFVAVAAVTALLASDALAGHRRYGRGYRTPVPFYGQAGYSHFIYGYSVFGGIDYVVVQHDPFCAAGWGYHGHPWYGYGYGVGTGGYHYSGTNAFGGSPTGGNYWYWLQQQVGNGRLSQREVDLLMYGRR